KTTLEGGLQSFADDGQPHFVFGFKMVIKCSFCDLSSSNNVINTSGLIPFGIDEFEGFLQDSQTGCRCFFHKKILFSILQRNEKNNIRCITSFTYHKPY